MDLWEKLRAEVLAHRRQQYRLLGEEMINRGADDFIRLVREAMNTYLASLPRRAEAVVELPEELTQDPRLAAIADRFRVSIANDAADRQRLGARILRDREDRFRSFFSGTGVSESTIQALIDLAKQGGDCVHHIASPSLHKRYTDGVTLSTSSMSFVK